MQVRTSYVSNSSTSSFILLYRDESAFDFMKDEKKYYKRFMKDLNKKVDEDDLERLTYVLGWLFSKCLLKKCEKFFASNDEKDLGDDAIAKIAVKDTTLTAIVKKGIKIQDKIDEDEFSELREMFGQALIDTFGTSVDGMKVGYVEYSGEDGDVECYMENEFMEKVANEASKHGYDICWTSDT